MREKLRIFTPIIQNSKCLLALYQYQKICQVYSFYTSKGFGLSWLMSTTRMKAAVAKNKDERNKYSELLIKWSRKKHEMVVVDW